MRPRGTVGCRTVPPRGTLGCRTVPPGLDAGNRRDRLCTHHTARGICGVPGTGPQAASGRAHCVLCCAGLVFVRGVYLSQSPVPGLTFSCPPSASRPERVFCPSEIKLQFTALPVGIPIMKLRTENSGSIGAHTASVRFIVSFGKLPGRFIQRTSDVDPDVLFLLSFGPHKDRRRRWVASADSPVSAGCTLPIPYE